MTLRLVGIDQARKTPLQPKAKRADILRRECREELQRLRNLVAVGDAETLREVALVLKRVGVKGGER